LSTVWVQADVYEKDLARLRVGQPAFITVVTYPDQQFRGQVSYVSDFLDPQTRTAKVRCEVPNADLRLKLDMYANVSLPTTFSRRALAVPAGAIQRVDERTIVFVRKNARQFEARTTASSGMSLRKGGLELAVGGQISGTGGHAFTHAGCREWRAPGAC
jgi:cobalt-zinc-cadmium efflux system membrane fusion protein